jgi:hypothetical protein
VSAPKDTTRSARARIAGSSPSGPADDQRQRRAPLVAPALEPRRKTVAGEGLAALVKRHDDARRKLLRQDAALLGAPLRLAPAAAFRDLDDIDRKSERAAKRLGALPVALDEIPLRAALQDDRPRRGRASSPAAAAADRRCAVGHTAMRSCGRSAPHIFSRL